MRNLILLLLLLSGLPGVYCQKPILVVTTDIGQDPDDQQSMVRLLHYANEFEIQGLIANADANYAHEAPVVKDSILHKLIDAYAKIEANLRLHDPLFPTAESLHAVVKKGCAGNGVKIPLGASMGKEKDTEGSNWIIELVDRENGPIHIAIWGGACDLAQALWKVKNERLPHEVAAFVSKLRVFFIGKQDSTNDWIIENFPRLWLILALDRGGDKWESGYRGMFWGGDMSNTSKQWLHSYIIGKNPLASLYPDQSYTGGDHRNPHMAMKEGDSPSFLFFLSNGLQDPAYPVWGGWGGRYEWERGHFFRDANDRVFDAGLQQEILSPRATVFRWRDDFQRDFANRVTWGFLPYTQANHPPVAGVLGDFSQEVLHLKAKAGEEVILDASGSWDPEGDRVSYAWWIYPEAGGLSKGPPLDGTGPRVTFQMPSLGAKQSLHIILRLTDNGPIPLTTYRRIVIRH